MIDGISPKMVYNRIAVKVIWGTVPRILIHMNLLEKDNEFKSENIKNILNRDDLSLSVGSMLFISRIPKQRFVQSCYLCCLKEGRRKRFELRVPKIQIRHCADVNQHEKNIGFLQVLRRL